MTSGVNEIFEWLSQYGDGSFNFGEDLYDIRGDVGIVDPAQWRYTIDSVLEGLDEALEIIKKYGSQAPDDLPTKQEMKRVVTECILGGCITSLNGLKKLLKIDIVDINTIDQFREHSQVLQDLIKLLSENTIEDVMEKELFEDYEEKHDNAFSETLGISKDDLESYSYIISSTIEDYFEPDGDE